MNREWIENVIKTDDQEKELLLWCDSIGYNRYERLYDLISCVLENKVVPFELLRDIARYDFHLSDMIHSMIKFVELRIRAFLINEYGEIRVNREEYLYQISDALSGGQKRLDCSTYYDKSLKREETFERYLEASGMETLLRIFALLPEEKTRIICGDFSRLRDELNAVREIRNNVAHSQVLLSKDNSKLKAVIIALLKYIPTEDMKKRRVEELSNLNKSVFVPKCALSAGKLTCLKIELSEAELNEIGL